MHKRIRTVFCAGVIALAVAFQSAHGQDSSTRKKDAGEGEGTGRASLVLLARSYGDSVVLRWAPGTPVLWTLANAKGYLLSRLTVNGQRNDTSDLVTLTPDPVRPWTLDQWKSRARRNDTLAAVAAQMLYGKRENMTTESLNFEEIEKQKADEENRFSYALIAADLSPFVAQGLGLRWVDRSVLRGQSYAYFLHALVDPGVADSAVAFVDMNVPAAPASLPEVRVEELDRAVRFSWNADSSRQAFSAFSLERSDDGGKTYRRTRQSPTIQTAVKREEAGEAEMSLVDSLPLNYRRYQYRITGLTPFGDAGIPAGPFTAMGRDRTPPLAPEEVRTVNIRKHHVRISWKKTKIEPDLAGYLVGRGESFTGPFLPLFLTPLGKTATEYVDTGAVAEGMNYYVVSVLDTAGNAAASVPAYVVMVDTLAPARPRGLTGVIDSLGVVRLNWRKGAEKDLQGYLLYFANSRNDVFAPVTGGFIADTAYVDTIAVNTLTSEVFYTLVAFDLNRNPSKSSDTLRLHRPDRIPPVAPVFLNYLVTDSSVTLEWIPSSSADVDSHFVVRRRGEEPWKRVQALGARGNRFVDTTVEATSWYEYSLEAMDRSRLVSERSFPLRVRVYDSGRRPSVRNLRVRLTTEKKNVVVEWQSIAEPGCRILVYRARGTTPPVAHGSAPGNAGTFEDDAVEAGESYSYAVRAQYRDGGQSPLTPSVVVSVPR